MKRLLKIVLWLAGLFVVLLILVVIGFKLFFPQEKARAYAVEKGSELLGRGITISEIDLSLMGGLGLQLVDVKLANPNEWEGGEFLTAANIDLKLQLMPLLGGDVRVDRLIINNPKIRLMKRSDGRNNYTFESLEKKAPLGVAENLTPEAKTAGLAVSFDQFEIIDGELEYIDEQSGQRIRLRNLNLSTSLANPRSGIFESTGKLTIGSVEIESKEPIPRLTVELDYRADFNLEEMHLDLKRADLVLNGLAFTISGLLTKSDSAMTARVNLKAASIMAADLFKLLPPEQLESIAAFEVDGDFSLDIDLDYDDLRAEALAYAGSATLIDLIVKNRAYPGELRLQKAIVDFKPDNLRVNIEQGTFDGRPLKGHLVITEFDDPSVRGEIAGSLDLAFIRPFLPEGMQHEISGMSDLDVRFSGKTKDPRNLDFSGSLSISNGRYFSPMIPEPLENLELDAYFDTKTARIKNLSGEMKSGSFSFNGRVHDLVPFLLSDSTETISAHLVIDGQFKGNLDLAILTPFLPPKGNPVLSGKMEIDITLNGSTANPERLVSLGRISVAGASYNDDLLAEPLESFDADLRITPDTITVKKMQAQFPSSDVLFTGKLIDPFPYLLPMKNLDRSKMKKPLFIFELTSRRFDVDKLFPEAAPGSGVNRSSLPADSVSVIILPDIDGRGTFSIDSMIYAKVEFSTLIGKVKIHDRRIECYDVTGNVYSGTVGGSTTIDLADFNNPRYVGKFRASQIEADDFVSRFTKFGGHLFGKVNLDGSYDARGWEPEAFMNSLSMRSTADLKNGKIVTSGFVYEAISSLTSKMGQNFEKEQPIRKLATNILVENGRVKLDKLTASLGKIGDISIDGFYSFSGDLNYNGTILLSEEMTKKLLSSLGLKAKSVDRVRLPISVGGTTDHPKMNLDFAVLTKEFGKNLLDEATGLLKGFFKKKKKDD